MATPPSDSKYYGIPIYASDWVPCQSISDDVSENPSQKEEQSGDGDDNSQVDATPSEPLTKSDNNYMIFAGGGGPGNSGIQNALVVVQLFAESYSLSDQPVAKVVTGDDLPYRMAVHPDGNGVIFSSEDSCCLYEWEREEADNAHNLSLRSSERVLKQLQKIGQQMALRFNEEGSVLALGGEDGHLRVFKWPSMDSIIDVDDAHRSVKDLHFSLNGKFLVSVGTGGPGRVWDIASSKAIATLPMENGEIFFGFSRFSHRTDSKQVLYTTVMRGQGGGIVTWDTSSWSRISLKQLVPDAISAFDVSAEGNYVAIGTVEGNILILNSANMQVLTSVRKAHMGIVTTVVFSRDSRALVSASMSSSARVTLVSGRNKNKEFNAWFIIFFILFPLIAVGLAMWNGATPQFMLKSKPSLPWKNPWE